MNKKITGLLLVPFLLLACSIQALPIVKLGQSEGYSVETIFIKETSTNVYILINEKKECIIVDPALRTKEIQHTLTKNNFSNPQPL